MTPAPPSSGSAGAGDSAFSPEQLLSHAPFVRALARALVRDDASADDLAQESLLAALEKPPRNGSLRAWLVGVVRNLARQRHRGDERRLARESAPGLERPPPPATPRETAERLELFGRLVAAVQRLDEPYRATIVRRFFDGASAQEIASEQGAPLETVRTRIKRGLERLRVELDAVAGGRAVWSALLAPWVAVPVKVAATAKLVLAAAAAVVATTSVVLWPMLRGDGTRAADATSHVASKTATSGGDPLRVPANTTNSDAASRLAADRRTDTPATPPVDPFATWIVGGFVRGGTRDGREQPRSHARVRAKLWEGYEQHGAPRFEALVAADELGRFHWPLHPPPTAVVISVRAEEPDSYAYSDERFLLAGDPPPQDFDLPCYPMDAVITGVVFGPDAAPAHDAQVSVLHRTIDCDEHGEFSVTGPRIGDVQIVAWAPGCAEVVVEATPGSAEGSAAPRIEIHLKPGRSVHGHVKDAQGNAIAGATVSNFFLFLHGPNAVSDAQGAYVLDHLPAGESRLELFARADGFCQSEGEVVVGELGTLDFVMRRGVTVSGRVLAPDGTPARGASVVLGKSRMAYDKLEARTHDDGDFTIADAHPGSSKFFVEWRGAAPLGQPVEVPAEGAALSGLVLQLQPTHFIAGRVVNERGEPVASANVAFDNHDNAAGCHTVTDAAGRFRIESLPAGPLDARIYAKGFGWKDVSGVAIDRDDFDVALEPAGKAAGRVVDDATGEPITHFVVRFVNPKLGEGERQGMYYGSSWSDSGKTFDDADGYFETGDGMMVNGSILAVEVSAEGYAPSVADHVVLVPDPDPDALEIRLRRGSALEGLVVDANDGQPVGSAIVKLVTDAMPFNAYQDSFAATRPSVRTDASGRFRLDKVATGRCRLVVEHPDFARAFDGPIDVPRVGSPPPRTIRIDAGGSVEGVALTADGRPIGDAIVRLYSSSSGESIEADFFLTVRTDASGRFDFHHLPVGRVQLSRELMQGNFSVQAVTLFTQIESGKTQTVRLAPPGTATLRGRLHAATAQASDFSKRTFIVEAQRETPRAVQRADASDPPCSLAVFAHADVFELTGIPAGKYRVFAHSAGFTGEEQWYGTLETDIAEGQTLDVTVEVAKAR